MCSLGKKREQKVKSGGEFWRSYGTHVVVGIILLLLGGIGGLTWECMKLIVENERLKKAVEEVPLEWPLGGNGEEPQEERVVEIKITFTKVPGRGAGADLREELAGQVDGLKEPGGYKIVIYSLADWWYVQPWADSPLTNIGKNGQWHNLVHLGRRYAALVVEPAYEAEAKVEVLPVAGGEVLAVAEVEAR